jgi:hypothetical protein
MDTALLVILIVIGNLSLYWLLFGKKKLEDKMCPTEPIIEPQIKEQIQQESN